jgi:hypothetical protein
MIEFKPECMTTTNNLQIVCREPGTKSKMTFENPTRAEVLKIKVDGCQLLQNDRWKCDFLVIAFDKEHFVELKGQDLNHAVKQLESAILLLSKDYRRSAKFAFVKCSKVVVSETIRQNWKEKFRREFNARLVIKSSELVHVLSE